MHDLVGPLAFGVCFETNELPRFHSDTKDYLEVFLGLLRKDKEAYLVVSLVHISVLLLLVD